MEIRYIFAIANITLALIISGITYISYVLQPYFEIIAEKGIILTSSSDIYIDREVIVYVSDCYLKNVLKSSKYIFKLFKNI